ncbi:MFS transporter [Phenylobacterium sp.]|uniref:MFS transporter n=1 Tax=Phenylobacterium sp. TaxID=1871053 RepID=UPI00351EA64B
MSDATPTAGGRKAAFSFVFVCALMNAVSFGIMIPVLPNLIKSFTGGDTAEAALWNVVFGCVWGIMQLFCGPILGMLSDRIGRRPVLLISLFGLAVDFMFMAFAPNLAWLFVGRVLNGVTAASFSTANAYVADVTPPQDRAKAFGWMGSAFSFGFLVGPALGGFLAEFDLRLPFLVAGALTAINWLYGYFVLPESLPVEKRTTSFDWKRANPVGSLAFLRAHGDLLGLAGVGFLFQLAHTVLPSIFVLYSGYRYGWSPGIIGLTMMATGLLGVGGADPAGGACGGQDRRAGGPAAGGGRRLPRLRPLWLRAHRLVLYRLSAGLRPAELHAAGAAGADDPSRGPEPPGSVAGREPEPARGRLGAGPDHVRHDLRLVDPA